MKVYQLPAESTQINKVIYLVLEFLEIPPAGTVEFIPEPDAIPPF